MHKGYTVDQMHELTKIDKWFLEKLQHIIDIDEAYIDVTFDSDDKKKKRLRKFLFPGSFFQGLLQIG